MEQKYTGIGLMSGTSLDGLDIVSCEFILSMDSGTFRHINSYSINDSLTIEYPADLRDSLSSCMDLSGEELTVLDRELGEWMGRQVKYFIDRHKINCQYIASHGHTVFHQPERGFTLQIGNGNVIHALTGIPVVCDFRMLDVALDGQGAPLVPIGDQLLFADFDFCLNIGGFANVSFEVEGKRKAYDIGAVNIVMNSLSRQLGETFDPEGQIARSGDVVPELASKLNQLTFYQADFPKSLGKEWVDNEMFPLLNEFDERPVKDVLYTYNTHIATVIANDLNRLNRHSFTEKNSKVLITGGGAYNQFLIDNIRNSLIDEIEIVIPEKLIVDFKEAMIFALMGLLRLKGINNCLSSVTGAGKDCCSGVVIGKNDIDNEVQN